jgi:hydrogenase 3 maturation protease
MSEKIIKNLKEFLTGNWVILGIGNRLKGDDGFGSILAEKLRNLTLNEHIFDSGIAPENYLPKISKINPDKLLIVDAVLFNSKPGEIKLFEANEISSPFALTHGPTNFSLMKTFLKETEIKILAVQPKTMQLGNDLSSEIAQVLDKVLLILAQIINGI